MHPVLDPFRIAFKVLRVGSFHPFLSFQLAKHILTNVLSTLGRVHSLILNAECLNKFYCRLSFKLCKMYTVFKNFTEKTKIQVVVF